MLEWLCSWFTKQSNFVSEGIRNSRFMASVSITWSHCAQKCYKHEIIKTIHSCGYSTFYDTDHFSCSCKQINNPGAEGGNEVTWGTKRSENKKIRKVRECGWDRCKPFYSNAMPSVSSLVSSGESSAVFCLRFTSYKIKTRVIILRVVKWSDFFLCIPSREDKALFIPIFLKGSPNECFLHACRIMRNSNLGIRIAGSTDRPQKKKEMGNCSYRNRYLLKNFMIKLRNLPNYK